MSNPIDLTTLAAVKTWLGISGNTDDSVIADVITSFSAYVLRMTGRGPADGTIPATSPFNTPVAYDEFYDGSGSMRQPVRNWPIVSVTKVNVNGQDIPASTNINVWGYVIDGDASFISLRGGYNPAVATFQNYRYQRDPYFSGPGFTAGTQNVEIAYSAGFAAVPFDLEMAARRTVSLTIKRKGWIGQRSQAMAAGAGTVTYDAWEMDPQSEKTLMYYRRRVA
jgi:hypothetical protein